jgi:TolA-binding protein
VQPATADKAPPTPPPSEVALLHNARKLAVKQPAAALSVLHEHAERFPNGLLKPEREVLTIEVLRRLGRTTEATQRLQQFETQYPKSLYLRRLHEPAPSD